MFHDYVKVGNRAVILGVFYVIRTFALWDRIALPIFHEAVITPHVRAQPTRPDGGAATTHHPGKPEGPEATQIKSALQS